ncbi:hypothetical protein [Metallosphaera tengchongensis]|uniref:hypothetical protein n=1 Tax=Metallosphaera tengchongensis TaxID=1532350 RepID=UPI00157DFC6F|nr:hypothetical protein [Metallosphaera tengchongensis]
MEAKPFINNLVKKLDQTKMSVEEQLNKEYQSIIESKRNSIEEIRRKALKELS